MDKNTIHIKTISEYHKLRGLTPPVHPLISVVDYKKMVFEPIDNLPATFSDLYSVAIKRGVGKLFYGQQQYDFDEGVMYCMAPKQVLRVQKPQEPEHRSGWILLIHPDFLWGTPLAKQIKKYEYFNYAVHEALFLSEKEEATINQIIENIRIETQANIDSFSQSIIIAQLETLLNYTERFYQRQFITRKITNHEVLDRFDNLLNNYFNTNEPSKTGLPTVQYVSEQLNISASYLSGLLKTLTGQSTQNLIHNKVIEQAKEKLSTTTLTVSEIAFELGFEHPQSFNKLFKSKTNTSPLAFRESFN